MRSFRKIIFRAALLAAFVALFDKTVRFCYESWTSATAISKEERTALKGTLDTVYCGTSLVFHAFNPAKLDEDLGTSSFCLGTGGQPVKGTYYLLRETADENPIRRVYMALSISTLKDELTDTAYLSASENFRTLRWKLRYLLSVGRENVTRAGLLYSTRLENYFKFDAVFRNVAHKLTSDELPDYYAGRGFRQYTDIYQPTHGLDNPDGDRWDPELGEAQAQEESVEYLKKIGEFCREQGIELTFVFMPLTQNYINSAGDLDALDSLYRDIAEEAGATYYNFNLYKERQEVFTNDKFKDWKHLNLDGSEAFCDLLEELLQSDDPEAYFYDSMEEFPYDPGY